MLAIISPAKKLDFESEPKTDTHTLPDLLDETGTLVKKAKSLTRPKLKAMMKISDKLVDLNFERFKAFETPFHLGNARQAALSFAGDTYVGLDAASLTEKDLEFGQDHLRILSGLYGLLRPLDLMQPYRLEMGTKFPVGKSADLYDFWGSKITERLNDAVGDHRDQAIINLASNEYASVIKPSELVGPMITPVFKEEKDGKARVIGLFAKRARGMMARYIIKKRLKTSGGLKKFNEDGYTFQPEQSDDTTWVFSRPQP